MKLGKGGREAKAEWVITFNSLGCDSCDPKEWERFFLDFDASAWNAEAASGGGLFQYCTDAGRIHVLIVLYREGLGFLLQLNSHQRKSDEPSSCLFAVADPDALAIFEELEDWSYPRGCFLTPPAAWLVVEDFLNDPERPSRRVKWVDDHDIPWPEI